jgi:hypothetical protein
MSGDRRGFEYALEPVCSITAWKIDELGRELARHNIEVAAQQQQVDALAAGFGAARMRVIEQRRAQALIDIDAQRVAHAYMLHVQNQLTMHSAQLRIMQQQRDEVRDRLIEERRFADSLERDKEAAAGEHDLAVARRGYLDADDNWMQRLHWRKSQ